MGVKSNTPAFGNTLRIGAIIGSVTLNKKTATGLLLGVEDTQLIIILPRMEIYIKKTNRSTTDSNFSLMPFS